MKRPIAALELFDREQICWTHDRPKPHTSAGVARQMAHRPASCAGDSSAMYAIWDLEGTAACNRHHFGSGHCGQAATIKDRACRALVGSQRLTRVNDSPPETSPARQSSDLLIPISAARKRAAWRPHSVWVPKSTLQPARLFPLVLVCVPQTLRGNAQWVSIQDL